LAQLDIFGDHVRGCMFLRIKANRRAEGTALAGEGAASLVLLHHTPCVEHHPAPVTLGRLAVLQLIVYIQIFSCGKLSSFTTLFQAVEEFVVIGFVFHVRSFTFKCLSCTFLAEINFILWFPDSTYLEITIRNYLCFVNVFY
jgi:hypothetical protein